MSCCLGGTGRLLQDGCKFIPNMGHILTSLKRFAGADQGILVKIPVDPRRRSVVLLVPEAREALRAWKKR